MYILERLRCLPQKLCVLHSVVTVHSYLTFCHKDHITWKIPSPARSKRIFSSPSHTKLIPALGPTQLPLQWAPAFFSRESSQGMKLTTHSHLVLRLGLSGAVPLLSLYSFVAFKYGLILSWYKFRNFV